MPRDRLPTHFIVYPQWMACAPVLGKELTEATVTDQSILGGTTMLAYEARWDALESGALPADPPKGMRLVDEVDVADLASEKAHAYDATGALDQDNQVAQVGEDVDWSGEVRRRGVTDGGRMHRSLDRFTVRLPQQGPVQMVMRISADELVDLSVAVEGREAATVTVNPGSWAEPVVELPGQAGAAVITVSVKATSGEAPKFHVFHYWFYAR